MPVPYNLYTYIELVPSSFQLPAKPRARGVLNSCMAYKSVYSWPISLGPRDQSSNWTHIHIPLLHAAYDRILTYAYVGVNISISLNTLTNCQSCVRSTHGIRAIASSQPNNLLSIPAFKDSILLAGNDQSLYRRTKQLNILTLYCTMV